MNALVEVVLMFIVLLYPTTCLLFCYIPQRVEGDMNALVEVVLIMTRYVTAHVTVIMVMTRRNVVSALSTSACVWRGGGERVYMYVRVFTYVYVICTGVYICMFMYRYMRMYVCMYVYACVYERVCMCACGLVHVCMYVCMHV